MKVISTNKAPKAIGPYSQAIEINGMVFTSGQIALLPSGELIDGGIEQQTHQVMKNLSNILDEAGISLKNIVKTTIFLSDMSDFEKVNNIYESYFIPPFPVRSTVAVKTLPKNVKVEIDCIAIKQ